MFLWQYMRTGGDVDDLEEGPPAPGYAGKLFSYV